MNTAFEYEATAPRAPGVVGSLEALKLPGPDGYHAWIADTMPPVSEWLRWRREFLVDTRAHEATLELFGNYASPNSSGLSASKR